MIAIKNAFVPPSCYFCPMTNDGLYLCKANNPYKMLEDDCEERRPDWCPLVPVPPHGDLIDRDQFIEFIKTHWDSYDQRFVEQLEARPTIIPASEEG